MDYYTHPTCQVNNLGKIYKSVFGYKEDGFFVDVGAFDGITYSNTYGLALAGWSGILFEPVKEYHTQCLEAYRKFKNIEVLNLAAGNKQGARVIYTGKHAVSTLSQDFKNRITNTNYGRSLYTKTESCSVVVLDSVLLEHQGYNNPFKTFDVLSIDVEGYELEVLEGFSINLWKPKMVIIEAHELHKGEDRPILYPEINKYFSKARYNKIYSDEINNIYVRK